MDPKLRKLFLVLFAIGAIATIIVFYVSERNLTLTWILGGITILCYILFRFTKKKIN